MQDWKRMLKRTWNFIWNDDSLLSWIVNIVLAFILIKFLVYPGLGLALGTTHPVVDVVSESMEHSDGFDIWWEKSGKWYAANGIKKEDFLGFPFKSGFNKGDIMVLMGKKAEEIGIGEVIVFWSARQDPIIHRVVKKWQENGIYYFQTKGDNNPKSIQNSVLDETKVSEKEIIGKSAFRIPWLGYIKIWFIDIIGYFRSIFAQKG